IVFGSKKSKLRIGIYRKAKEMVAHGKLDHASLHDYEHALRLEMRLMNEKLVQYLGNERNTEEIDGDLRLVRFYPGDLIAGERSCFTAFEGVFLPEESHQETMGNGQLAPLGQLLALVAL